MRSKSDYALIWANGASFSEVYDLMKADIDEEIDRGFDTKCESELCDCDNPRGTEREGAS